MRHHRAHAPIPNVATMVVAGILAVFHLAAPTPAAAQTPELTRVSPGPDGELALLQGHCLSWR